MTLKAGARLGPYEILSPIGAGGMGEVWRARDPRLSREVAVKVLPAAFTEDTERLARFQREAQLLAALNHANIAAIYGVEEASGAQALVLELVEGDTLAEKVAAGPLDPLEALGSPRLLFEKAGIRGYDVAPDGKGFYAVLQPPNGGLVRELHLVTNWFEELNRLAPAGKR